MPKRRSPEEVAASLAADPRSMQPWQIKSRLRRGTQDPEEARIALGGKHIDEWDPEELARGKPRNAGGTFTGKTPAWVTEELQDEAARRFKAWLRREMAGKSVSAIRAVGELVHDAESDRVRLDAAKFLLEQVVGKPQQEITGDVRMDLQHMLAGMLVNPDGMEAVDYDLDEEDVEEVEFEDDDEDDLD